MIVQLAHARRRVIDRPYAVALGLLLLGVVLLLGVYVATSQLTVATTTRVSDPPLMQRLATPAQVVGIDCGVTGDLVGDANPAEVARVLCAAPNQKP